MTLLALRLMAGSDKPIGARRLSEVFAENGIDAAEATSGRYLRALDNAGLTQAVAKQGRVLTKAGEHRLKELLLTQQLDGYGSQVLSAVKAGSIDELLDLLYSRRAVEPEAARLAALRATPSEIKELAVALDGCVGCADRVRKSHDFHLLVARASHNRMLFAVASLLLDDANEPLSRLSDTFSARQGAIDGMASEHQAVFDAIRHKEPYQAEILMRSHIDSLIAVAEKSRLS